VINTTNAASGIIFSAKRRQPRQPAEASFLLGGSSFLYWVRYRARP
jgi:hypothetical protein